jgi:hypothetical protein
MVIANHAAHIIKMNRIDPLSANLAILTTGLIFFFLSEKKMLKTKGLFRP